MLNVDQVDGPYIAMIVGICWAKPIIVHGRRSDVVAYFHACARREKALVR